MSTRDDILRANERYAASFPLAGLEAPPRRRLAVLTCMDARLDPAGFLGLEPGDAHLLRNAGGRATDEVAYALELSRGMGTREVLVVGHDRCAALAHEGRDPEDAVREAVERIRALSGLDALGFLYDEATGRIRPVE